MGVTRIVSELVDQELILEAGKVTARDGPGRQGRRLEINPDGAFVFGVSISSFVNELTCVDARGEVRFRIKLQFEEITDPLSVIDAISDAIELTLHENINIPRSRVLGIGAAVAGVVDNSQGVVRLASYLGWSEVSFGELLKEKTGFPVVVENLANTLNLAERRFGSAHEQKDILLVSGGTTCGASLIHNDMLVRGATSQPGQIGHVSVEPGNLTCSCGRTDCLNTIASGWSILVNSGGISQHEFDSTQTNRYAEALEQLLLAPKSMHVSNLLGIAGSQLARAAGDACLYFNPALVLVVGALCKSKEFVEAFELEWQQSRLGAIAVDLPSLIFRGTPPVGASAYLALDAFLFHAEIDLDRSHRQRSTYA